MIVDVDLHYISWQLVVWQLNCVSGLFLWVRVKGRDVRPCFSGCGLGRIVLGVVTVCQFLLVSWRLRRRLSWMGIRLLMFGACICKPIVLLLSLQVIGLWRYLISCAALRGWLYLPPLLVHWFVDVLQNLWCARCLCRCRIWLTPCQ